MDIQPASVNRFVNWRFSNLDTYTLPYTFPDFSPETLQIYCKNTKQHYFTAKNRAMSKAGATPAPTQEQASTSPAAGLGLWYFGIK
nr:MAG TPA: hypothetical protein [Caudoviricetes sp.]